MANRLTEAALKEAQTRPVLGGQGSDSVRQEELDKEINPPKGSIVVGNLSVDEQDKIKSGV